MERSTRRRPQCERERGRGHLTKPRWERILVCFNLFIRQRTIFFIGKQTKDKRSKDHQITDHTFETGRAEEIAGKRWKQTLGHISYCQQRSASWTEVNRWATTPSLDLMPPEPPSGNKHFSCFLRSFHIHPSSTWNMHSHCEPFINNTQGNCSEGFISINLRNEFMGIGSFYNSWALAASTIPASVAFSLPYAMFSRMLLHWF